MSNHRLAIVPCEAWAYSSPELKAIGRNIDVGLLAESLIYYERVLLNIDNSTQYAELLKWLKEQDALSDYYELLRDKTIRILNYAFLSTAVQINKPGEGKKYDFINIQDSEQAQKKSYVQRVLYRKEINSVLSHARERKRLYSIMKDNTIVEYADEYGRCVDDAKLDMEDPRRSAMIVQALVDGVFKVRKMKKTPTVRALVLKSKRTGDSRITWNIDFKELKKIAGKELSVGIHTPAAGISITNRLLWSAGKRKCDLYLGSPIGRVAGDKLYEIGECRGKKGCVIESLVAEVDYPDIRRLVNERKIGLKEILKIRKKAERFRDWLDQESDRDRNAIIAYHNEITKDAGLSKGIRKMLKLFGVIGGGAVGTFVGGEQGFVAGAIAGSCATELVSTLADELTKEWKPVVFGEWLRKEIGET